MRSPRVIRARICVVTADEGGRTCPIHSGYRGRTGFPTKGIEPSEIEDFLTVLWIEDGEPCPPGSECSARIEFGFPEQLPLGVGVGTPIVLREGRRVTARGTIVEVIAEA